MKKFIVIGAAICTAILISCKSRISNELAVFHANATHTGYYAGEGVRQLHGMKWKFKTNGRVFSSPVISRNMVVIGSDDSSVYSLNSKNGNLIWKFKTGGRVSSTATVYNGKIFVVSFDGNLYSLDQETGKEIWRFKTAGEHVFAARGIHGLPEKDRLLDDPWDTFLSSPVVANGNVYFGSGSGIFYALDCNSGKKIWEFETKGVIHSSPAYSDSTVFFGSWDSYMYALNSVDGSLRWSFKTGTDSVNFNQVGFQSSPVVYKGVVYSGCRDANVWAIDAKTGKMRWKYFNNGSWVIVTPAVHSDTLYFTTSDTHKLIALNTSDGKILYETSCKTFGFSSPVLTGGKIYLGNFGGSLMSFNSDGKPAWEFRTEAAIINRDSILTINGEFDQPKIFKENSYTGMLKSMDVLYSIGSILSSPAVVNGIIYFGSTDGNVYALN